MELTVDEDLLLIKLSIALKNKWLLQDAGMPLESLASLLGISEEVLIQVISNKLKISLETYLIRENVRSYQHIW
jgi:hypothetical protein